MFIKLIWATVMFLVTSWAVYIFAIGLNIPVAYYEKSETIICNEQLR